MSTSIQFISPRGEAYYPSLNKTETYKGHDTGKFTLKLVLSDTALEEMRERINQVLIDAYGSKKAPKVWEDVKPIRTTKEGGKAYVKFMANAVTPDGKARIIPLYDSAGSLIVAPLNLGTGSIIRVNGTMIISAPKTPWVAFYMNSVQVLEYIPKVHASGFDAVPGGFTV